MTAINNKDELFKVDSTITVLVDPFEDLAQLLLAPSDRFACVWREGGW